MDRSDKTKTTGILTATRREYVPVVSNAASLLHTVTVSIQVVFHIPHVMDAQISVFPHW